MRFFSALLLTGCTLNVAPSAPDANGLRIQDDPPDLATLPDLTAPPAQLPDLSVDLSMPARVDLSSPPPDLAHGDLTPAPPRASPIAAENRKPGSRGWRLSAPSNNVAGFADRASYAPGELVSIHAAAKTATAANWELWRLGYYGGTGGRKISWGAANLPAAAAALLDPSTGMVHAPWPVSFTIPLATDAVTGFYVVKLVAPDSQAYVPLVVRGGGAPAVWPVAFDTYQAYNAWGGTGLYNNTRSDWPEWHAYAVSYDRPYLQGDGAGQLFFADRDFITFVEGQGYDLDYLADGDFAADGARRLIVLEGHSEYWTGERRAHLESAIAAGTNVMVLGANDLYWRVRQEGRSIIGYKEFADRDPDQAEKTTEWRPVGKPENALLGVQFGEWIWSSVPMRVGGSWIWDGAPAGGLIPGLYGFEIDRRYDNGAEPAGVVEVGSGLGENHSGELALGQATVYTAPSGATVFASGTVSWSQALAGEGMWDARVQKATHALFKQLGGASGGLQTLQLPAGQPAPDYLPGVQVSTVTSALEAPVALAPTPDGCMMVADGDRILRVTPSGTAHD